MRTRTARLTLWYAATIVAYRPNARIYFYTLHFDADGVEIFVGLPDDTIQLREERVTH